MDDFSEETPVPCELENGWHGKAVVGSATVGFAEEGGDGGKGDEFAGIVGGWRAVRCRRRS